MCTTKEFIGRFQISPLNMEERLRWVVEAYTASSHQAVAVQSTETNSRRAQTFGTIFAATVDTLWQKAGTEQVYQF